MSLTIEEPKCLIVCSVAVAGNDMWVWHDVAEDHYYALMGVTHGTSFVRITDPLNPEVLGTLPTQLV